MLVPIKLYIKTRNNYFYYIFDSFLFTNDCLTLKVLIWIKYYSKKKRKRKNRKLIKCIIQGITLYG